MAKLPPPYLCIIAALCIVGGVNAVVIMIASLIKGHLFFNVGFALIPIGYGILIGKSWAKTLTLILAAGGGLIAASIGGWSYYKHLNGTESMPYPTSTVIFSDMAIIVVGAVLATVFLIRKHSLEWFKSAQEERSAAKSFTWALAVVGVIYAQSHIKTAWWMDEVHASIFTFEVIVQPFNEETGEANISIGYGTESTRNADDLIKGFPKVRNDVMFEETGTELRLSGVATRPFDYFIQSEGLQEASVRIDKDSVSSGTIRLPMQPLPRKPSIKENLEKEKSEDQ